MSMEQYKEIFINESEEHLQLLNTAILELERSPDDRPVLNNIFRYIHTLKGMSATMGFNKLTRLTHRMEDMLDFFRRGEMKVTSLVIDILLRCLDLLEELLEEIKQSQDKKTDIEGMLGELDSFLPGTDNLDTKVKGYSLDTEELVFNDIERDILLTGERSGFNIFKIIVHLISGCELKSVRAFMVCRKTEEIGDIIKAVPSIQYLEEGRFGNSFMIVVLTRNDREKVKKAIMAIAEIEKVDIEKIEITMVTESTNIEKDRGAPVRELTGSVIRKIKSIRVSTERLDKLMNLVGELVISKIRLIEIANVYKIADLAEVLLGIDRLTQELQDLVLQSRLVPISYVFDRFPRMVRDLAKSKGKKVELSICGADIELDRTVLDEIADPMVHILRNAIDHGIEMPEEREKSHKNPVGTILLKALRERTHVSVEISDDGSGMDIGKIKEIAVQKGFITHEAAALVSNEEVLNIITLPGFTATDKVTDISGRGVGMDVVKNKIETLGGSIDFNTTLGKGTSFVLKLPMTIAIIQAMLIDINSEIYAIPLGNIRETIKINRSIIKHIERQEVINLRDEVLPLLRLKNIFVSGDAANKKNGSSDQDKELQLSIVIVEIGNKKAGLVVDVLIGQQEVVIKNTGRMLRGIRGFSGATILGNGRVALIIDVASLI
ncbi:MAG: chemotaxis protein CheA [Candidatus Omnitrophota bacterium]